jgi:hypothetical protein
VGAARWDQALELELELGSVQVQVQVQGSVLELLREQALGQVPLKEPGLAQDLERAQVPPLSRVQGWERGPLKALAPTTHQRWCHCSRG